MKFVSTIVNWKPKERKFDFPDKSNFINEMMITFDKECILDVIIEKQGRQRSNRQNSYLWGVPYKLLSDHTGYTPDEIHGICKDKFLKTHYEIGEERFDIGASTAKLSTIEFEEYTENIRQWGATLGVNIPAPNESENILNILTDNLDLEK